MKKFITILAVLLITASQTLLANDGSLTPSSVKNSFETKYGNKINVAWSKINDVYIGTFTDNDQHFELYYSENGDLLGSARYISPSYLPLLVSNAVNTRFPGFTITHLVEFTSETNGTSYYVRMNNDKMQQDVRAYS